ncbi:MAG: hypothetical protein ABI481_03280, partial [Pyrinomonadaceae bacterium]
RPTNSPGNTDVGNWNIRQSGSSNSLRQVQWGVTFTTEERTGPYARVVKNVKGIYISKIR